MSVLPPPRTPLDIDGPAGTLEALLEDPGGEGTRFAVVCHPHPLHGGTMHNKVVFMLARALQEQGMPTLRFNYRGVGAQRRQLRRWSRRDRGRAERDRRGAGSAGRGRALVLAGFSFGGAVALRAARPLGLST